jgi:hypothetical protein
MNKKNASSVVKAVVTVLVICNFAACAGGNASRAMRDNAGTIKLSEYNTTAKEIVKEIVNSPSFIKFRDQETKKNGEIVLLLQEFTNLTDDPRFNTSQKSFFNSLEEAAQDHDMTFRQDLDRGLPNYVGGIGEFDKQDSDSRYDQSTGDVTTGAASKAIAGLQLTIEKQQSANESGGGTTSEYVLRAKIINGRTKTLIVTRSVSIEKNNR